MDDLPQASAAATDGGAAELKPYVDLVCETIARLDAISLQHLRGLLDIAIDAAKVIRDLRPASAASATPAALPAAAELAATPSAGAVQPGQPSGAPVGDQILQAIFTQDLTLALRQALIHQQQVNMLGTAILAKSAAGVLEAAVAAPGGA